MDVVLLKDCGVALSEHMVGIEYDLAGLGIGDGLGGITSVDADAEGLDHLSPVVNCGGPYALRGAAVLLADDDVLRDIDHSAGEVAGVGGTQSGIGQALAGASG